MRKGSVCKLWSWKVRIYRSGLLGNVMPRWHYCVFSDHPYFVGLQAHPEFCTRPLNPSPPFLGFVAAACDTSVFEEQLKSQLQTFRPPHPKGAMVGEQEIRNTTREHILGQGGLWFINSIQTYFPYVSSYYNNVLNNVMFHLPGPAILELYSNW